MVAYRIKPQLLITALVVETTLAPPGSSNGLSGTGAISAVERYTTAHVVAECVVGWQGVESSAWLILPSDDDDDDSDEQDEMAR